MSQAKNNHDIESLHIESLSEVSFVPLPGVPRSRAECRDGQRPCPYVRCKWHLWLILGNDRPGRRFAGRTPPTTLRPAWLETPVPPCCTLDVAESAELRGDPESIYKLSSAVGLRPSRIHDIIARALEKLRTQGGGLQEFTNDGENPNTTGGNAAKVVAEQTPMGAAPRYIEPITVRSTNDSSHRRPKVTEIATAGIAP